MRALLGTVSRGKAEALLARGGPQDAQPVGPSSSSRRRSSQDAGRRLPGSGGSGSANRVAFVSGGGGEPRSHSSRSSSFSLGRSSLGHVVVGAGRNGRGPDSAEGARAAVEGEGAGEGGVGSGRVEAAGSLPWRRSKGISCGGGGAGHELALEQRGGGSAEGSEDDSSNSEEVGQLSMWCMHFF